MVVAGLRAIIIANIYFVDFEEVTSLVLPISAIRHSWNRSIAPVALAEPALLHAILAFASSHLKSLKEMPLANCLELVNSHKMAAIQLVNQQLQDVRTATRPSVIAAIYILAAQEVRFPMKTHLYLFTIVH